MYFYMLRNYVAAIIICFPVASYLVLSSYHSWVLSPYLDFFVPVIG